MKDEFEYLDIAEDEDDEDREYEFQFLKAAGGGWVTFNQEDSDIGTIKILDIYGEFGKWTYAVEQFDDGSHEIIRFKEK